MSATSKKNVIYLLRFSEGQKNNIPWRRDIAAWLRFHSLIGTETFVFGRDLALREEQRRRGVREDQWL
jgi:hypothetical protein